MPVSFSCIKGVSLYFQFSPESFCWDQEQHPGLQIEIPIMGALCSFLLTFFPPPESFLPTGCVQIKPGHLAWIKK